MSESKIPPSNNFWPNSSKFVTASLPISEKKKKQALSDLLSAVDESPEFYDPYSDLNLYLSQKIKQQMQCASSKKWSNKIQDDLFLKILPDFQEKFPQLRLGVSALKKTWEKVLYYSEQIAHEREAIDENGKLNIAFFIRENLKNYVSLKNSGHLHPSYFAHQLAMKISECVATVDGIPPNLDYLTKMIWSVQRHLIAGNDQENGPYDEYDSVDKLIVKLLLEITAKNPQIGQLELEEKIKEDLRSLGDLPSFSSHDQLLGSVSALVAEKLDRNSCLHTLFLTEQKTAMMHFIRRHSAMCKTGAEFVRRITALYALASNLPKNLQEEEFKQAVLAIYPQMSAQKPPLPQALYAFIAAELVLMKSEEYCFAPSFVADAIWTAYKEATLLPNLQCQYSDLLEIAIWKSLSQTENLLEKLPYRIGQRIEEEVANLLIENPTQSFANLVQETVGFFKKAKELVHVKRWDEIEKKVHLWSLQGDMLCSFIRVGQESTLLHLICQKLEERSSLLPHHVFVSEICQDYLKKYPELAPYSAQLTLRVWTFYKYAWYTQFGLKEESSFDRFLKWHSSALLYSDASLDQDRLVCHLTEIVHKTVPLVPFDLTEAHAVLTHS